MIALRIGVVFRDLAVADGERLQGFVLRRSEAVNVEERFIRDLLPPWDDPACGVQVGEVAGFSRRMSLVRRILKRESLPTYSRNVDGAPCSC